MFEEYKADANLTQENLLENLPVHDDDKYFSYLPLIFPWTLDVNMNMLISHLTNYIFPVFFQYFLLFSCYFQLISIIFALFSIKFKFFK